MYSVLYALPSELWLLIAQCLSLADLTCLILTSSRLLSIIRPALYRAVHLHTGLRCANVTQTLALLVRDKELARRVVQLDLTAYFGRGTLVDLDALMNLVSLKQVKLYGGVFRSAVEQREFGRVLASIPLEELTYMELSDGQQLPDDQLGGIRDLKKIVWHAANECSFPFFFLLIWHISRALLLVELCRGQFSSSFSFQIYLRRRLYVTFSQQPPSTQCGMCCPAPRLQSAASASLSMYMTCNTAAFYRACISPTSAL